MVSYQLVDVAGSPGTVLSQNQYKVTKEWLRYAAHTASDEVFEKLTGIRGAFRTRIAYVVTNKGVNTLMNYVFLITMAITNLRFIVLRNL